LDGLGAPPAYFPQNVMLNINGYESLDKVMSQANKALDAKTFEAMAQDYVVILDVRHENDFVKKHIPGSIFIGIQGNFAPWVGALIMNVNQPLLLVIPEGREQETITRLARVGFDHALGYLKGGIEAWEAAGFETDSIKSISPEDFAAQYSKDSIVVDARKPGEYAGEHVADALNIPLDTVNTHMQEIPQDKTFYLHCQGGYRSVIMASILKARGYHNIINVEKGFVGIKNTTVPVTDFVCPSQKKQVQL